MLKDTLTLSPHLENLSEMLNFLKLELFNFKTKITVGIGMT